MRFIAGFRAAARAASALTAAIAVAGFASSAVAQVVGAGGGFSGFHGGGGGPVAGVGVGAYGGGTGVPTSGPTGPSAFFGGGKEPFAPVIGFLGGGFGGGYGGYGGYGGGYPSPGVNSSISNYNYTYNDYRRRDGGFYGGGGVFYADDGYSRMYADRPSYGGYDGYDNGYRPAARTGYAPVTYYRPAQHVYYLPTTTHRVARKRGRYEAQY